MVWLYARSWRAHCHFVLNSTKREAIKKEMAQTSYGGNGKKKKTRSLDWKQEKLRGSTVRRARGHLRGKPWSRYIFSWEQIFFRGLTKKFIFFGESHNSENFTKKYSLSYWSRALSNFSFLVFRFSGPHKERPYSTSYCRGDKSGRVLLTVLRTVEEIISVSEQETRHATRYTEPYRHTGRSKQRSYF